MNHTRSSPNTSMISDAVLRSFSFNGSGPSAKKEKTPHSTKIHVRGKLHTLGVHKLMCVLIKYADFWRPHWCCRCHCESFLYKTRQYEDFTWSRWAGSTWQKSKMKFSKKKATAACETQVASFPTHFAFLWLITQPNLNSVQSLSDFQLPLQVLEA